MDGDKPSGLDGAPLETSNDSGALPQPETDVHRCATLDDPKDTSLRIQRANLRLNRWLVAVTATYCVFAGLQWRSIVGSVQVAQRALKSNDAQIQATRKALDIAGAQLSTMRTANALTERAAAAAELSAKSAADTVVESRQQTLFNIEAFEQSERARLVQDDVTMITLRAAAPLTLELWIRNIGKRPAESVRFVRGWVIVPGKLAGDLPMEPLGGWQRMGPTLYPGEPYRPSLDIGPLSDAQVSAIRAEDVSLFVYGRIAYRDGFGRARCLRFCHRYSPTDGRWLLSPTQNREDPACDVK